MADDSALPSLTVLMESIKSARITNALIAALDDEVMEFATKGGFSTWAAPADLSPIQCLAEAKWRTVGGVLRLGYSVLVVDPETVFFRYASILDPVRECLFDTHMQGWSSQL